MKYFTSLYHEQVSKNWIASDEATQLQISYYDFF